MYRESFCPSLVLLVVIDVQGTLHLGRVEGLTLFMTRRTWFGRSEHMYTGGLAMSHASCQNCLRRCEHAFQCCLSPYCACNIR